MDSRSTSLDTTVLTSCLEDARSDISDLSLDQVRQNALDKGNVSGIADVTISVLLALKLHHKGVRNTLLRAWSVSYVAVEQNHRVATCMPSMLLSTPPIEDLMYGFFEVGCMHLSLSPSISSQACLSVSRR